MWKGILYVILTVCVFVGTVVDHWILGKMEKKRGCGNQLCHFCEAEAGIVVILNGENLITHST